MEPEDAVVPDPLPEVPELAEVLAPAPAVVALADGPVPGVVLAEFSLLCRSARTSR